MDIVTVVGTIGAAAAVSWLLALLYKSLRSLQRGVCIVTVGPDSTEVLNDEGHILFRYSNTIEIARKRNGTEVILSCGASSGQVKPAGKVASSVINLMDFDKACSEARLELLWASFLAYCLGRARQELGGPWVWVDAKLTCQTGDQRIDRVLSGVVERSPMGLMKRDVLHW